MRTSSAAVTSLTLLLLSAFAAFGQRADYAIEHISPAVDLTPQVSFQFGPKQPAPRSQQWLEIEVDFSSRVPWTDELTVNYFILISGQCLTGSVTHIDIPAGRDLFSVMYVSPKTLSRILSGGPLTSADIQDVGVQLVSKGQVLVTKSYKARGAQQWWENLPQVAGKVLNKDQTPFSSLIWDRYEQIKTPPSPQS